MNYEETIELENNIKIKNEANAIYNHFLNNVKLNVNSYKGKGRFVVWSDSHNIIYIRLENDIFTFECRFLHETYNVVLTPSGIFNAIKQNCRGIGHLKSHINFKG